MKEPILVLERAHARDAAAPYGRPRGTLAGVTLTLGAGVHAFLGAPHDGTLALADLVTGTRRPLRGRVTVLGRDPARTAFLRARIGALPADPRLPSAPTVRAAVRLAMRARGETGDRFNAVLDPLGLSRLQARDPRTLSFAEQRAVELALALSTPAPALLFLHEPLCDVAVPHLDALHLRLREAAASGACVVLTTSSPADARALSDRILVLHQGLVAREARGGAGLVLADAITLEAHVRTGARDLCAALSLRPEIRAVSYRAPASPTGAAILEITGDRADTCALALLDCALDTGADLEALTETAPTLGDVRTATETLLSTLRPRPLPTRAAAPAQPAPAPAPAPEPEPDTAAAPAAPAPEPPAPSPPPPGADP